MSGLNAIDKATFAAALNAEAGAPAEILLVPAGNIVGRDGRAFVNDRPDAIVADFAADGLDLPVDANGVWVDVGAPPLI